MHFRGLHDVYGILLAILLNWKKKTNKQTIKTKQNKTKKRKEKQNKTKQDKENNSASLHEKQLHRDSNQGDFLLAINWFFWCNFLLCISSRNLLERTQIPFFFFKDSQYLEHTFLDSTLGVEINSIGNLVYQHSNSVFGVLRIELPRV